MGMTQEQSTELRPIDAPHYRYWQALYLSFFSGALYVDVGKRWKGLSMGYFLLLSLMASFPFSLRLMMDFNHYFAQQLFMPIEKLPDIYIQNGQVVFDKPMPFLVKDSSGGVIAIVDTTGKVTGMMKEYPKLSILITKNKLLYRVPSQPEFFFSTHKNANDGTVVEQVFPDNMNQIFNGAEWLNSSGIENIKLLTMITIYPTMALVFFSIYMVFFLAFGLMAQLMARIIFKQSLTYLQSFRLLIVSSTPHFVVLLATLTANWVFTGYGTLLLAILAIYFSYSVLSLKRESNKLVRT
jgi:hypothetical protein